MLSIFNRTACKSNQQISNDTFPIKADEPPRRAMPTATLAGAPPGAFLNAGASANESPLIVGTKSISISPKHTISGASFVSDGLLSAENAFALPEIKNLHQNE